MSLSLKQFRRVAVVAAAAVTLPSAQAADVGYGAGPADQAKKNGLNIVDELVPGMVHGMATDYGSYNGGDATAARELAAVYGSGFTGSGDVMADSSAAVNSYIDAVDAGYYGSGYYGSGMGMMVDGSPSVDGVPTVPAGYGSGGAASSPSSANSDSSAAPVVDAESGSSLAAASDGAAGTVTPTTTPAPITVEAVTGMTVSAPAGTDVSFFAGSSAFKTSFCAVMTTLAGVGASAECTVTAVVEQASAGGSRRRLVAKKMVRGGMIKSSEASESSEASAEVRALAANTLALDVTSKTVFAGEKGTEALAFVAAHDPESATAASLTSALKSDLGTRLQASLGSNFGVEAVVTKGAAATVGSTETDTTTAAVESGAYSARSGIVSVSVTTLVASVAALMALMA